MRKQKKSRNKINRFQTIGLTQKQLRNRWILVSIGLILLLILIMILIVLFFQGKVDIPGIPQFAETQSKDSDTGSKPLQDDLKEYMNKYNDYDYESFYQKQISKPQIGEEIAEVYLTGTNKPVKIKLFEDEAPEIVKQFKELVTKGYYNNREARTELDRTFFTEIIDLNEQNMQDNTNTELTVEDISDMISWETIELKSNKVLPYNGAVCAYDISLDDKSFGVNFFVMNISDKKASNLDSLNIPSKLKALFKKYGGDPAMIMGSSYKSKHFLENEHVNLLDYLNHPTFGQVFEGMELIENITKANNMYKINKINIIKYEE